MIEHTAKELISKIQIKSKFSKYEFRSEPLRRMVKVSTQAQQRALSDPQLATPKAAQRKHVQSQNPASRQ